MAIWTLEPGHTAAEFSARHMMVTEVRGHFKNIQGTIDFDPDNPANSSVDVKIDAKGLWSGDTERDAHLRSADFLDVENHPDITFKGNRVELIGSHEGLLSGNLTIRGKTREVTLKVHFLGQWKTPFWEGGVDKGPRTRAGFLGTVRINRHDFGVSWNAPMDGGGLVVGNMVDIIIDAEAILESQ